MSTGTFEQQIARIKIKTEENLMGAIKNAIRRMVQEAQTPVKEGGKMRVDTGFMRWSGTASLNQPPSGLTKGRLRKKGEEGVLPEYSTSKEGGKMLNTALVDMKLGDTFYFGWTAEYAPYWEMYDGFVVSAVNNFSIHLNEEVRRLSK